MHQSTLHVEILASIKEELCGVFSARDSFGMVHLLEIGETAIALGRGYSTISKFNQGTF